MSSSPDAALTALAAAYGVADRFTDWKGRDTEVSAESLRAVLAALDVVTDTPDDVAQALEDRRLAPWRRLLPPCLVSREGIPVRFDVHVRAGAGVRVWVELETGGEAEAHQVDNWESDREVDGRWVGEATFELPDQLPLGYHRLMADSEGEIAASTVIITPRFLGFPEAMGDRATWGLATQLYSVRSSDSWGVGDLTDLTDLAVWSAGRHGAGYVLVNPLHAAEPVLPMEPSPYLPSSRRFFNPLYLRVERIPEYAELAASDLARVRLLGADLRDRVGALDTIDRNQSWTAKEQALRTIFAAGRSAGREIAFRAYCANEGEGLLAHATFCVLSEALGRDWRLWPEEYRDPASPEVRRFRAENIAEIDFHSWLQWCTDEQLRAAQAAAVDAGMELGIVHDLAVGVSPAGSDAWSLGSALARGVNVGAPPDQFTQLGQDWGQPPLRPDRLAELAYQPYRDLVAGILRHSGGVRVDHIIGLFRLWWVPQGMPATQGTYVRYDHEAMIGILALEAHRSGALVVGEDLGTVEPWVRDYLSDRGILGTSVLWFEQDWDVPGGKPFPPERWREYCLASVTTHDLPPTLGYLAGDHVRLRHRLGLLTESLDEELAHDARERQEWLAELRHQGLLAEGVDDPDAVLLALHRYLVRTPSRMRNIALVDAVGDRRTQNQPGTVDEYPNWRVPLTGPAGEPMLLEDVFASERAAALCEELNAAR
ncbi:4-alpha-glucanotransferase [Ammonicoccus fulvus]|uniref:4-alpha-glucanotransferase n=1 Tax=Ammonicoccus fulvus TaxID=3138240 RepID=A0ABZ3FML6_9ACTN